MSSKIISISNAGDGGGNGGSLNAGSNIDITGQTISAIPAGVDTDIQLNVGGNFGTDNNFTYDVGGQLLTVVEVDIVNGLSVGEGGISVEGEITLEEAGEGIILRDRSVPANTYRIYVDNGAIQIEGPI